MLQLGILPATRRLRHRPPDSGPVERSVPQGPPPSPRRERRRRRPTRWWKSRHLSAAAIRREVGAPGTHRHQRGWIRPRSQRCPIDGSRDPGGGPRGPGGPAVGGDGTLSVRDRRVSEIRPGPTPAGVPEDQGGDSCGLPGGKGGGAAVQMCAPVVVPAPGGRTPSGADPPVAGAHGHQQVPRWREGALGPSAGGEGAGGTGSRRPLHPLDEDQRTPPSNGRR